MDDEPEARPWWRHPVVVLVVAYAAGAIPFSNLLATINNNLVTAVYQGTTLIGTSGSIGVVQDVLANQLTLTGQYSTIGTVVSNLSVVQMTSVTSAGTFLLNTFLSELNLVATSLNVVGALNQRLANQVQFNTNIEDALTHLGVEIREQHLPPFRILELAGVIKACSAAT